MGNDKLIPLALAQCRLGMGRVKVGNFHNL